MTAGAVNAHGKSRKGGVTIKILCRKAVKPQTNYLKNIKKPTLLMFHKILRLVLNILFFSPHIYILCWECVFVHGFFFRFTITTETGTLRSVTKRVPFPNYTFPLGGFYGTLNRKEKK